MEYKALTQDKNDTLVVRQNEGIFTIFHEDRLLKIDKAIILNAREANELVEFIAGDRYGEGFDAGYEKGCRDTKATVADWIDRAPTLKE